MIPDLDVMTGALRLIVAVGLAAAIGLERELSAQEAGLRTHILVGLGSCLFVIVGVYAWADLGVAGAGEISIDPGRIVSYVVSGIGFLGAGAILKEGLTVTGLTTAASLWVTAAIGVASGVGNFGLAAVTTLIVLASLWPLRHISKVAQARRRSALRIHVRLPAAARTAAVVARLEDVDATVTSIAIHESTDERRLDILVATRRSSAELIDAICSADGVLSASVAD